MPLITPLLYLINSSFYLANAGIPLFTQSVYYQIFLFIPIIAIEAYIHNRLLKISIVQSLWFAFITNFISTLGGGFILVIAGAWLGSMILGSSVPVQPGSFPLLPLEIIVTLIPMFFFSVVVELLIGAWRFKKTDQKIMRRSLLIANGFTYFMLEILAITQLIKGYLEGRG